MSPETARALPIRLLESGPAGGGLATAFFGQMAGKPDVISFDMGGTTAEACLIENGRAATVAEMEAGAPPQQAQGGLNCTWSYAAAHAAYPLKCVLSPGVRSNAGCYRAFDIKLPPHSILNADKPASVNLRTRTGWYIAPNIFRALADAAPGAVQPATGLPHAINIYGHDAAGQIYADHFFTGGGQGASAGSDGKSALLHPTSAANTSIELMETRAPILVLEKSLVTDSGGPRAAPRRPRHPHPHAKAV